MRNIDIQTVPIQTQTYVNHILRCVIVISPFEFLLFILEKDVPDFFFYMFGLTQALMLFQLQYNYTIVKKQLTR